jgi:hypothetical protein
MLYGQESGSLPEWVPALLSLMGMIVMGILSVSIVRDLVKGWFPEPERPELLPQTLGNSCKKENMTCSQSAVLPTRHPPRKKSELKYLADSPEFLTQTIKDIGYRDRIDSAFQEAIIRARQGK